MEYEINSGKIIVQLKSAKIETVVGDAARMDCQRAINYIKSGEAEIDAYVDGTAKPAIDSYVNTTSKAAIDDYVTNTAEPAIDAYVTNTAEPAIDSYVTDTAIPQVDTYVSLAKQWAIGDPSEPVGNSAKYWADEASTIVSNTANKDLSNLSATGEAKFDAKQDVISDLSTIRSGAALGATAVQSVTTGTTNGTIKVDGNAVSVYGLGSAAYTASTDYDAAGAASTAETSAKNYADSLASNYATAAQGAKADTAVQPSDLATVATTGDYDDLTNKPTIPTVNNATLTITQGGISKGTFTANASSDVTIALDSGGGGAVWGGITGDIDNQTDLKDALDAKADVSSLATVATTGDYDDLINKPTIPAAQVNSDWNADSGVAQILNKPSLATVATSGAYADLSGTPTIPTVNDATLTIQKNGASVATFTANSATNATANITVPTDTSDLTNGAGFITSASLPTNYVTTNTAQDISAQKTFLGEKAILLKQTATADKLGFTLYNTSNTELGAFEWRPNTIGSGALLNLNMSYSSSNYLGFRYWGTAVNIIAPKVATAGNYYIPVNVTNGNTTVTATSAGTVNISSLLPTVNNATLTIQKNGTNVATFTANASSNVTANISVPNTVSSVSSSSTNADAVGAKLFYDTCGDIETLINAL